MNIRKVLRFSSSEHDFPITPALSCLSKPGMDDAAATAWNDNKTIEFIMLSRLFEFWQKPPTFLFPFRQRESLL